MRADNEGSSAPPTTTTPSITLPTSLLDDSAPGHPPSDPEEEEIDIYGSDQEMEVNF